MDVHRWTYDLFASSTPGEKSDAAEQCGNVFSKDISCVAGPFPSLSCHLKITRGGYAHRLERIQPLLGRLSPFSNMVTECHALMTTQL